MKTVISLPYFTLVIFMTFHFSCTNPSSKDSEVEVDIEWQPLFNGNDLSGWYTYQRRPEPNSVVDGLLRDEEGNYLEPIGLNKDPLEVFTVVTEDEDPAIRISGETFGILVTDNEYENYHLKLEFKWGDEKYPPREDRKMDSGILYHSIGPEGAWGEVWMKSLECQIQETDCGDYISVDTVYADIPAVQNQEDNRYYYNPEANKLTFGPDRSYCNKSGDYENPIGMWNTAEIYAFGNNSIHTINGQVNMRVYNSRHIVNGGEVPLAKGKIQLQSEGAEIFYRDIQIRPINKLPKELTHE